MTTAHQSLAVGTKINASDKVIMPLEGADFLPVSTFQSLIVLSPTTAHQSLAVGTKINAIDRVIMPLEGADFLGLFLHSRV
jgi:hypothetical protein